MKTARPLGQALCLAASLAGVLAGAGAMAVGSTRAAEAIWSVTTAGALAALLVSVGRRLARRQMGVDVIALLALATALAQGEPLAGAIIALMLSTGLALEAHAGARARADLSALLGQAPKFAHRYQDGGLHTLPLDKVASGDRLLVKPGEAVPVDGLVDSECAVLDESALTGEAVPVRRLAGEPLRSGGVNAGGPFDMRATAPADESTYAAVVRLVEYARDTRPPSARLADRYALVFVPLTLVLAVLAWALSGDPRRALAVLVVATPCPMILAVPVAIVAGVSRCARRGVIVKSGAALEALAGARVLVLDKTGTVTRGAFDVSEVLALGPWPPVEVLRLAGSLEQVSPHILASAVLQSARTRGLALTMPTDVHEVIGSGIRGRVEGRLVCVGRWDWIAPGLPQDETARRARRRAALEGAVTVFVSIDTRPAAALILHDPVRTDATLALRALRRSGIERIVLLTGDHPHVAEAIGAGIGADAVLAERSAAEKVEAVRGERAHGPVAMVGDGVNDSAALAAADVGVAMGARGAAASSQAADIVLMVDRVDRLSEAMRTARRSRHIALQSAGIGMGLSLLAMGLAAVGLVQPVAGALLQELIDVAAILNALRAVRGVRRPPASLAGVSVGELQTEHNRMRPEIDRLRAVADRLDAMPADAARAELGELRRFLEQRLVPHEKHDEAVLYPIVAELIGGDDPTAAMSRAHLEIAHLTRLYGRLLDELPDGELDPEDLRDVRRVLYSLAAVLRLHFAQEDEHYLTLLEQRAEQSELVAPAQASAIRRT